MRSMVRLAQRRSQWRPSASMPCWPRVKGSRLQAREAKLGRSIFASSSYAGSAGTRPRCDLSDENVLISTLLEQQSGPVIGRVWCGCVGALSPTASMRTSSRRGDGHSSTPAACRQHSNSFDGLCEGRACFVLGNSVCSRSPLPPHLESVNLDPILGPDSRLHALERAGDICFRRLRRPLGTSDCTGRPRDPFHPRCCR